MNFIKNILFIILFAVTTTVISQNVYTTKTGEKYHKNNCHYLKYSKKEYTLEKAIQLGFTACSVCKPSASNLKSASTHNSYSNSSASTSSSKGAVAKQCTGKTKSGTRCKRKTKNSNQRCYQH